MVKLGRRGGGRETLFKLLPPSGPAGELECLSDLRGDVTAGGTMEGSRTRFCLEEASLRGPSACRRAASTSW